ncbi:4-aminobutyrate aminotransferase PuuE [Pigmentiphaga humi]|uniref:4-aminobutyrate aminotransferase PuuE n=1 Tax=Pigmentiphaga humi TaxID=2478468 RepID=A0A3P4B442_9BURK|nr:4-aminobutyrate--2-oxoglutarate transaminase [Pigmentiphaga humi]VCU71059.1 4-aminobutyrate aminotransferase PuuE [Pigmentiphaga humi]
MSNDWTSRRAAAIPAGVAFGTNIYAASASGSRLTDGEGRTYIDFAGGIGVLNVGHNHPRVVAAVKAQADRFLHTCAQVIPYESYIALAERLNRLAPGGHTKKTAFFSTGVEAVENAIKIARAHTRRRAVISFTGSFHGRTNLGLALTGKVRPYRIGVGPFVGDIYKAIFPDDDSETAVAASLASLDRLFKYEIDPAEVAAIVIEPVQGEGGFNATPPAFMQALRALCDREGIVLLADEIQCGMGRTGKLFAMEHFGVQADITTLAKSLAGGTPLSAVVGRTEIMDAVIPGGLGSTYAGAPMAIAAAHAVLDIFEDEGVIEQGERLSATIRAFLAEAGKRFACIGRIKGLGSMVGVELVSAAGEPDGALAGKVLAEARSRGLILLACGVHGNVIRFLYPLNTDDATFQEGLAILSASLEAATRGN